MQKAKTRMNWFNFIVLSLAVWRVSRMIVFEHGPCNMFERFRWWAGARPTIDGTYAGDPGTFADFVTCPLCLSIWIGAVFFLLGEFFSYAVLVPLACSAVTVLVELKK